MFQYLKKKYNDIHLACPRNGVNHSYNITDDKIRYTISTVSYLTFYNDEIYINYERETKTECKVCGKTNKEIQYLGSVNIDSVTVSD